MAQVFINGRTYTNEQAQELVNKLARKVKKLGVIVRIAKKIYSHFEEDIANYYP